MDQHANYRQVRFCGNFKDIFERVAQEEPEACGAVYSCYFRGERIRLKVFPVTPFPYPNPKDNRNYRFFVYASSKVEVKNLARKIERASSQRFRQQAQEYLESKAAAA